MKSSFELTYSDNRPTVCHDIAEPIIAARGKASSEIKTDSVAAPGVKLLHLDTTVTASDSELSPIDSAVSISPTDTTSKSTVAETPKSSRSSSGLDQGQVGPV